MDFTAFHGFHCVSWISLRFMDFTAFHGFHCVSWISLRFMDFTAFHGFHCASWISLRFMDFTAFHGFHCVSWISLRFKSCVCGERVKRKRGGVVPQACEGGGGRRGQGAAQPIVRRGAGG